MTLAETLKTATADAHRRAEHSPKQRDLVRGALPELHLAEHLGQMRHIHAELERLFDEYELPAKALEWCDEFRHSRRLDADLEALGHKSSSIPVQPATQQLIETVRRNVSEEPATLIGYFYVLEGSMNGNRFIVRALRQTPAASRCEFTYFDPYGDEQPARWAAFKTRLNSIDLEPRQQDMVVNAALGMFDGIAEMSK
ncbi:MAG: biliverdin-producing heme oxygenase [Planctomycetota bacterium]